MPQQQDPRRPQRRSIKNAGQPTTPAFDDVIGAPLQRTARTAAPNADSLPSRSKSNKPQQKRRSWGKRISLGILYTFLALGILGAGTFAYLYYSLDIPEADEVALAQTTTVYYSDGTTRMGTYSDVNRTIIDTASVPAHVGHAIVASEDRTFYTNSGIDLKGILRALYNNIFTGSRQGGSTLTQQYVERYYVGETTDYAGKAKEAILALKINREQSKEQILGNYMNTIYFGRGAYGIEAASKLYFGKSATNLTISEAALLAGIIPAPSAWDPALDEEQAKKRWKRVLDLMVEDGWISASDAATQTFPTTLPLDETGHQDFAGPQGHLLAHIRQELQSTGNFSDEQIETGGMKIISTIDKAQFDAMVAAANSMTEVEGWDADHMHVAMSAINPENGEIVAEYGGPDYLKRQQNGVTQDIAPAASTFKPFTLLAYAKQGGSIYDTFNGNSPQYFDGLIEPVENDGGYSFGRVNLIRATEYSMNTAFVALNEKVGPAATKKVAVAAGIPEETLGLDDTLLNTLGFAAPRNIDLASAYATMASGGKKTTPHIVREVFDAAGNRTYKAVVAPETVFTAEEISTILPALEAVTGADGTASDLTVLNRKIAGKTGTASEQKSAQFIGFIPQLSVAVSMYQSDDAGNSVSLANIGGLDQFHGGDWPTTVWLKYMSVATTNIPDTDFPWRVKIAQKQPESAVETPQSTPAAPAPAPAPAPAEPKPSEEEPPEGSDNTGDADPHPRPDNPGGQTPGTGNEGTQPGGSQQGPAGGAPAPAPAP